MTGQTIFSPASLLALLAKWVEQDWLRPLDLALTRFLWQEAQDAPAELLLAIALTSHQLGRGHVCLDLETTLSDPHMALSLPPERWHDDKLGIKLPADLLKNLTLVSWAAKLRHPELVATGAGQSPLVFDGKRLYLRRYWQYERNIELAIAARMQVGEEIRNSLPSSALRPYLTALFPAEEVSSVDWQKVACGLAATSAFSIITGGPGTGKTTTVVKLLALLQGIALDQPCATPLHIRLAAPTGKAAARLKTAIANAISKLPAEMLRHPALSAALPSEVITLHRLLGSRPNSRRFKHDARNPLRLDVLVIDEASMVDLEMMNAVLLALPSKARLILLGDKDQLASVEAGAVLGQLCRRAEGGHFTASTAADIDTLTGLSVNTDLIDPQGTALDQHIVMLRTSHRFTAGSGIGRLATAVNAGDLQDIETVWRAGYPDLAKLALGSIEDRLFADWLLGIDAQHAKPGYPQYLGVIAQNRPLLTADQAAFDHWALTVLAAHGRFQVLCALRNGPYGVSGLTHRMVNILHQAGLIQANSTWYEGRPVMVTKNEYGLGLMNGDIGIALRYPQQDKQTDHVDWVLRVAFPKNDVSDGIQWILPSRLTSVETVFALTVHKSQGSEFEHCALILPPKRNPVLTRELVYTGITRAKQQFTLIQVGDTDVIYQAATQPLTRSSGLFHTQGTL